jgi:hypothetical protein
LLFNIKRDPSNRRVTISLSDNILKKGVPEINRINYIAREQLINYYTNCEKKYLDGVKMVVDSIRKEDPKRKTQLEEEAKQTKLRQLHKIRNSYREKLQQAQKDQDTEAAKKAQDGINRYTKEAEEYAKKLQADKTQQQTTEQKTVRFANKTS